MKHFMHSLTWLVLATNLIIMSSMSATWIQRAMTLLPFTSQQTNETIVSPIYSCIDVTTESQGSISLKGFTQPVYNSSLAQHRKGQRPFILVTFVNGIYHSVSDWTRISNNLENIFRCEVRPYYNPTSGWWVKDISRAGFDLVLRPNDLILAKGLADHLRFALDDLHPNGRLLHLAHSGGAILTYLAAKHHLTYQEIARIDVATLGAGKSVTRKYFKGWVRNYYSRNDPLTIVDSRANKLLKRSGSAPIQEIRDFKHNTSFVFIDPLEDNPISDHSMECRTYAIALHLEAQAMKQRMQDILRQQAREIEWSRKLRKQAANITGLHHFWDRYLPNKVSRASRKVRNSVARLWLLRGLYSTSYSNVQSAIVNETMLINNAEAQ